MFIASAKMIAQRKMVIFAVLNIAAIVLLVISGIMMAEIPHQDFAFWIMLGVGMVGFFTLFWSTLGFMFALLDYRNETSTLYR